MKTLLTILTLFALTFSAFSGTAPIGFQDDNPPALLAGFGAEVKPDGAPQSEWKWHVSFTGKSVKLAGLAPGRWNIRVFAVSTDGGISDPSNEVTATILTAPYNLQVVPAGTVSLQISPDLEHWRDVAQIDGDRWFVRFQPQ